MLKETFGDMFSLFYISRLAKSCELFSSTLFDHCYSTLKELMSKDDVLLNIDSIMYAIELGDKKASIDNNLGEMKFLTMVNILRRIGLDDIFILCYDDRKVRYVMSKETNVECEVSFLHFISQKIPEYVQSNHPGILRFACRLL